ncbi:hypothetical protein [Lacrimispora indolis]|uniref:hypothetical protein n=1 Tax=Lacrimispora indolis TaxID=69825 RepID=UPI00045EA378|nr:hypothetical protein [Lacrimispora indolis]
MRKVQIEKITKRTPDTVRASAGITMVEAAIAMKAPPAKTFSATHPAYTYTSLCPDPALREPPKRKREEESGILPILKGQAATVRIMGGCSL